MERKRYGICALLLIHMYMLHAVDSVQCLYEGTYGIVAASMTPDKKILVFADAKGNVKKLNVVSKKIEDVHTMSFPVCGLVVNADASRVVMVDDVGKVNMYHKDKVQCLAMPDTSNRHGAFLKITALAYSSKNTLYMGSDSGDLLYMQPCDDDINSLKPKKHNNSVTCFSICNQNAVLFSGSSDLTINKWDMNSKKYQCATGNHLKAVKALAYDGKNNYLFSSGDDNMIKVWDIARLACIAQWKSDTQVSSAHTLAVGPEGLCALGSDNYVKVWNHNTLSLIKTYDHPQEVTSVNFTQDGTDMISTCMDGIVRLWHK